VPPSHDSPHTCVLRSYGHPPVSFFSFAQCMDVVKQVGEGAGKKDKEIMVRSTHVPPVSVSSGWIRSAVELRTSYRPVGCSIVAAFAGGSGAGRR
jgi:hypothetical protein